MCVWCNSSQGKTKRAACPVGVVRRTRFLALWAAYYKKRKIRLENTPTTTTHDPAPERAAESDESGK